MGAGTGYWGRLLQLRGVDIICYDLHTADEEEKEDDADERDNVDEEQEDEQPEAEEEEDGGDDEDEEVEVEVEQIFWMDVLKGTPKVQMYSNTEPLCILGLTICRHRKLGSSQALRPRTLLVLSGRL